MNSASCQQQATIYFIVYMTIIVLNGVSFYAWRRARLPWRTVYFTIFAICGLLIVDTVALALVLTLNPLPITAAQSCK